MTMRKQAGYFAMMAMMAGQSQIAHNSMDRVVKPRKKIIPKGLKKFFYGTESVYAINQKNADKKALKQGLIIDNIIVSCSKYCSPSDWCKGGKCDKNGCYKK